jgi:hypothetical protein
VKTFPSGAADVIVLRIAGDAKTEAQNASEFLDVEVEEARDGGLGELGELGGAGDLEA